MNINSTAIHGKEIKRYHSFKYKAGSWKNQQRVIVKIEVSGKGTNTRYIVTDLWEYRAKALYEQGYCWRGRMELNIKDHKHTCTPGVCRVIGFMPISPGYSFILRHMY